MCLSSPKTPKIEAVKPATPPPPPIAPERPQASPVVQRNRKNKVRRNSLTISNPTTGTNANSSGSGVSVRS
jgi:hypothetical protein